MTNLQVFSYNEQEITFDFSKEHKMINASQMAKVFDKRINNFFRQKSTQEYVKALLTHLNNPVTPISVTEKDLIYTVQGGEPKLQGTWVHKLVGIRLAQWLDPFFAIWVDERIEELLVDGFTTLESAADFRVIYFIKAPLLNRVKIGMTTNLNRRMTSFKVASPETLELLKVLRVNEVYQADTDIHELFPHLRINGEWFHLTKELQHFIDNLTTELPLLKQHKGMIYTQNLQELEDKIALLEKHLKGKNDLIDNLTKEIGNLQKECMKLLKREEKVKRLAAANNPPSLPPMPSGISQEEPACFYYKERHLFHKLYYKDIVYIEAKGSDSAIFTQDGRQHLVCQTLGRLEEKFPPKVFVRSHHQYILNLHYIHTIDSRERMVYLHSKWQWQVPIARRQHVGFLKHIEKLQH